IGLTEIAPNTAGAGELGEARRQNRHQAIVVVTRGARPGLCPSNADSFLRPFGPPVLQVTSERRWKSPPGSNDALILVKKCVKHWILIATRRSVPRRCECERRRPIPQAGVRGRLCRRGYVTWVLDGKPEGPFPLQQLRTP